MNQWCKVCDEPAAGFHFGAFTCEGCKSFFGRAHTNPAAAAATECKTGGGRCVIDKKNRTSCKACRLKKCLAAGMSKSGSRYGRRSNWFKIHCLLQPPRPRRQHDRDDRRRGPGDDDGDDGDGRCASPADPARPRAARPSSPATTPWLLFGFAPKSRAPLPRSESSAFRETVARPDDGDGDRPIDLTVRQKKKLAAKDDDDNNNETAGTHDSASALLRHGHDTAAPLDLTRSGGGVREFGLYVHSDRRRHIS